MNKLAKSLLVGLLENESKVMAFYGGGFKPPTKGHFAVAKKTLQDHPEITKLYIVVGGGLRNNISQDESYSIWNIYKKYLGDKIEIVKSQSPLTYIKDYIKENPDIKTYVAIGTREGDEGDAEDFTKRKEFFEKYGENTQVLNIITGGGISGTKARKSALESKDEFLKYIPEELTDDEKEIVWSYVESVIQEIQIFDKLKSKWESFKTGIKTEKEETKEAYNILKQSVIEKRQLTDEEKKKVMSQSKDLLKLLGFGAIMSIPGGSLIALFLKLIKQDKLITPSAFQKPKVNENELANQDFDYPTHIKSLTKFMLDKGLNLFPLPSVKFVNDDAENANNHLKGKTAYYDPNHKRIVLYTLNRHPKDVMRSFAHEIIHHMQNCENRLGNITTQDIDEDDHLKSIEEEAYTLGNTYFRSYTGTLTENLNKKDIRIDGNKVYQELIKGIENETDENFRATAYDFQLVNKMHYVPFVDFYVKLNTYYNDSQDNNLLGKPRLKYILDTVLNLSPEDQKIVMDEFDKKSSNMEKEYWYEKGYKLPDEEYNPSEGSKFDDSQDYYSNVVNYRIKNSKYLQKHRDKIVPPKKSQDPFGLNKLVKEIYNLTEGRYDKISNAISSYIFKRWKNYFENEEDPIFASYTNFFQTDEFAFELEAVLNFEKTDKPLKINGHVEDKENKAPLVYIEFSVDPSLLPKMWEKISMSLKDVVRHEIEHLTQADEDIFPSKFIEDDQHIRSMIYMGLLDPAHYMQLEKEVDANLQGLYFRAKKEKLPFSQVINDYLDSQDITPQEKKEVLDLWRNRSKALSLPKF